MANMENKEPNSQESAAASSSASSKASPDPERSRWKVHLFAFAVTVLVMWGLGIFTYVYFYPHFFYKTWETVMVKRGPGFANSPSSLPVNTLYTMPTLAVPSQDPLEKGLNRDTLYTIGWLDLSTGPEVLHVPDMADRYYSVQFTDSWGTDFAYVGRRTTGTQAGDYLISGPGWQGKVPAGVKQIVSPDNTVLLYGRTLVESDSDLTTAYGLAKQIQLTPLSRWHPGY
ncbi:conserved hypothetical protein [Candidatus Desulfosporosinus infrequens]|uniref:DUF1254 domain-containing protein n=1 Tax=Candidatus Desulfosporosinus infrequens TaxID=2043169 RepID=A0A2U3LJC5_9FIRM|nr:conserved hypothetical protein [Candidatus Desulfosporosinus infrequens]